MFTVPDLLKMALP